MGDGDHVMVASDVTCSCGVAMTKHFYKGVVMVIQCRNCGKIPLDLLENRILYADG